MRAFYSDFIEDGDLCFDVGANVGNRVDVFLELGARVIAVEPQDNCCRELKRKYRGNHRVEIVPKAVGETSGEARLMISSASTLSTLSHEWIDSVTRSGRFSTYQWDAAATVSVTTLDALIAIYGRPTFCKIDVEGFELQVLKGLSQPIRALSFEFAPEFIDRTLECVERLAGIGMDRFNYSIGESMRMAQPEWVKVDELRDILETLPDKRVFGDVYARSAGSSPDK